MPAEVLVISIDQKYPSSVYHGFQQIQHLISMYPGQVTAERIVSVLNDLIECYTHSQFTSSAVRFIIVAMHQLTIMIISLRVDLVTDEMLKKVVRFMDTAKRHGKLVCVSG